MTCVLIPAATSLLAYTMPDSSAPDPSLECNDLHRIILRRAGGDGGLIRSRGRDDAVQPAHCCFFRIIRLTLDRPAAGRTRTERFPCFRSGPREQILICCRGGDCC